MTTIAMVEQITAIGGDSIVLILKPPPWGFEQESDEPSIPLETWAYDEDTEKLWAWDGDFMFREKCSECEEDGWNGDEICDCCGGDGYHIEHEWSYPGKLRDSDKQRIKGLIFRAREEYEFGQELSRIAEECERRNVTLARWWFADNAEQTTPKTKWIAVQP